MLTNLQQKTWLIKNCLNQYSTVMVMSGPPKVLFNDTYTCMLYPMLINLAYLLMSFSKILMCYLTGVQLVNFLVTILLNLVYYYLINRHT